MKVPRSAGSITKIQDDLVHPPLHIVADENIPFVREAFGDLGTVETMPGREMSSRAIRSADVLLVRSVTRVDADLINGSSVKFVGSATIGTDHVDTALLKRQGIVFAHAPGSNAESVVEYVIAALFQLSVQNGETIRGKTAGIIGCGNIGGQLAVRLPAFGVRVLMNDPPLAEFAEKEGLSHDYKPLSHLLAEADIITLHVPLVRDGENQTYHLIDADRLARMKIGAWLVNSSRGAAVSNKDLLAAYRNGRVGACALDVWEGEPAPMASLLDAVDLATPHIAGYSFDGKVRGMEMLRDALISLLEKPEPSDLASLYSGGTQDHLALSLPPIELSETAWLHRLVGSMYNIGNDDRRMRSMLAVSSDAQRVRFVEMRKKYPRRRAFSRHNLCLDGVPGDLQCAVREGLRVGQA